MTTKKAPSPRIWGTSKKAQVDPHTVKHGSCFTCGRVTNVTLIETGLKDGKVPIRIWGCRDHQTAPDYLYQK